MKVTIKQLPTTDISNELGSLKIIDGDLSFARNNINKFKKVATCETNFETNDYGCTDEVKHCWKAYQLCNLWDRPSAIIRYARTRSLSMCDIVELDNGNQYILIDEGFVKL